MGQRVFAGTSIVGWVADSSLPRFGRLLEEPHSGRVLAVDVNRQRLVPLAGGAGRDVTGPSGSYVFDGVWDPDAGLFLAFGRTHGRGTWALLRVRDDGSVAESGAPADIAVMSLCRSEEHGLLLGIASLEGAGGRQFGGGIASFSPRDGAFSWLYRPPDGEHFVPSGVCFLGGAVAFVHTSKHVLVRLTPDGRLDPVTGRYGCPDADPHSLNTPTGVTACDGRYLVTDGGNHRVLLVDPDGTVVGRFGDAPQDASLVDPRHALGVAGRVYVADVGSRSVLGLGSDLRSVEERWGGPEAGGLVFSRPRSIDRAASGELIIADTNNDRIVGVDADGDVRWELGKVRRADGRVEGLRWPRSARSSGDGRLLVSDSLRSRFLVVDTDGSVRQVITRVSLNGVEFAVSDPHDGRWLAGGDLLLVDSAAGWVSRVHGDGTAVWVVAGLTDPHQAAPFGDRVVVVDPGLDGVLLVDAGSGAEVWRRSEFRDADGNRYRLSKPRVVHAYGDGIVVVDEDSQVVALGADWSVRWCWNGKRAPLRGHCADFEVPKAPRDVLVDSVDRIVLSDYRRNCVVTMEAIE